MAFQDSPPEDIRATLAVSQEEARLGGRRVINLPGGRTTTVTVPAGIRDGEELRLPGQGLAGAEGGSAGDLVLRVAIVAVDEFKQDPEDFSVTQSVPMPPPSQMPDATPPNYVAGSAGYTTPTALSSSPPGGGYASSPPIYQRAPANGPQSHPGLGSYPNYPAYAPAGQASTPQTYPPRPPTPPRRGR